MAHFAARVASYFRQRYGLLGLNRWPKWPKWFCMFVTPRITSVWFALIACWAISSCGYSGGLSPHGSRSKPCRVCKGVVEGCFFEQLSFTPGYCLDPFGNRRRLLALGVLGH
jgi:hypothetical protein